MKPLTLLDPNRLTPAELWQLESDGYDVHTGLTYPNAIEYSGYSVLRSQGLLGVQARATMGRVRDEVKH